jgi:two-component system response regulator RegA
MSPTPERLLIVDDDEAFRERLARAMRRAGLEVATAADGDAAIAAATSADFDFATVDLRMPGPGGLDVVRQLHHLRPEMRVVVLTGYGSISTAVEAMRGGAIDYIRKPATAREILDHLRGGDDAIAPDPDSTPSLASVEWEHIHRVLSDCDGNISEAARVLGIHRRSLQRKLARYPANR